MDDEAFAVLEAIGRSGRTDSAEHQHWIKAFKAIRWVVQTEAGLALTPAGRRACDDRTAERRSGNLSEDRRSQVASSTIASGK